MEPSTPNNTVNSIVSQYGEETVRVSKVRAYYELTKPGITQMVIITAAAAYYLGVLDVKNWVLNYNNLIHFIATMIGVALVSSGSCALNQVAESDEDRLMKRTSNRPIPSGMVSANEASIFAVSLLSLGAFIIAYYTNVLTLVLSISTVVLYNIVYTPMKKRSVISLFVGAIPGALPALGGWTSVRGEIGFAGLMLFLIMFIWQIPHFLSLAYMYKRDYADGGFVILGIDKDSSLLANVKLMSAVLLLLVSIALSAFGVTGILYSIVVILTGLYFIYCTVQFKLNSTIANARLSLIASYIFVMGTFLMMFVDKN